MIPSILLITQGGDMGALSLAAVLNRRAACRVMLIDHSAFSRRPVTLHPESGRPSARARATDPSPSQSVPHADDLDLGQDFDVIYCRAATLAVRPFERAADADYAAAEIHAFGLSWLWTRRDVLVNRPTPGTLCGTVPDLLRIARACADVGLSTPDLLLTTDAARVPRKGWPNSDRRAWPQGTIPPDVDLLPPTGDGPPLALPTAWVETVAPERLHVLVCGGDVIDAPPPLHSPILALARALDLDVAEIRLAPSAQRPGLPVVLGVAPVPTLATGAHVRTLAVYLEQRAAEHRRRAVA